MLLASPRTASRSRTRASSTPAQEQPPEQQQGIPHNYSSQAASPNDVFDLFSLMDDSRSNMKPQQQQQNQQQNQQQLQQQQQPPIQQLVDPPSANEEPFDDDFFADFNFGGNDNNNNTQAQQQQQQKPSKLTPAQAWDNNDMQMRVQFKSISAEVTPVKKKKKRGRERKRVPKGQQLSIISPPTKSKSQYSSPRGNPQSLFSKNNSSINAHNNARPKSQPPLKPKEPSMGTRAKSANVKDSIGGNAGVKKKKMKKIDVLPLLHKGIRANKFKMTGNKSKVRKFYLTENNYFFCWDAVGANIHNNNNNSSKNMNKSPKNKLNNVPPKSSGGFFSKFSGGGGSKNNGVKVDPNRSIPIRSIRSLIKNPAYTMQTYNFIPPSQKSLTISIVYMQNGSEKRLNFMNYERFHNVLFYEGLKQLWDASKKPNRNLSEVFELYVEFSKDILPKHLRPQKFKWEPLGANDYAVSAEENAAGNENNNNTLNPFFDNSGAHKNVNMFDPTRDRLKSF